MVQRHKTRGAEEQYKDMKKIEKKCPQKEKEGILQLTNETSRTTTRTERQQQNVQIGK